MRNVMTKLMALAALATLLSLTGCGAAPSASENNSPAGTPTYVRLVALEHTQSGIPVRAVGRLETKQELRLSFKVGGIVDKMLVDEGQSVRAGQLLASLSLTEINAQLTQAHNGFDKADRDLQRVKNLFADSVATLEQLQNATTAWEVAKAGLDAAMFNRQYAQITAPTDGRVLQRLADDHEQVSAGSPVLVMAGFQKGWVIRTALADRDVLRLKIGDSAGILIDALPDRPLEGAVSEIAGAPNPANGTYEVEIKIGSSTVPLMSGLIGKVVIVPSSVVPTTLVPVEALVEAEGARGFIFTPSPDGASARRVSVSIAYLRDGKAGVLDRLDGITSVITAGATKLSDGAPIAVVK